MRGRPGLEGSWDPGGTDPGGSWDPGERTCPGELGGKEASILSEEGGEAISEAEMVPSPSGGAEGEGER